MDIRIMSNLPILDVHKIKTAASCWLTAELTLLLAEREAPEPTLSENIIKLQITDNHILSTMKSKSKSF